MTNLLHDSVIDGLDTVAQQALLEHQILQHVTTALRLSINWQVDAVGSSKKVSTVRFTAQSFQRHLDRLLMLEEGGGYMQSVRERRPTLYYRIAMLQAEHDQFRSALSGILQELNRLTSDDAQRLDELCHILNQLLDQLDLHHLKEVDLIQEALLDDVGGEG